MRQPDTQIIEENIDIEGQQAANQLLRELLRMILQEGATEEALLLHIKANTLQAFGRELDDAEVKKLLAPVLLIAKFAESQTVRGSGAEAPRDEQRERVGVRRRINFAIGSITLALRMHVIVACPGVADSVLGKYTSLVDGQKISIFDVLNSLGGMEGLASDVVHKIEAIRTLRQQTGDTSLLEDADMEVLSKVLFLINRLKIKDSMFCDFGQGILRDLRVYVKDYEDSKK